jgi:cytidine deaminase
MTTLDEPEILRLTLQAAESSYSTDSRFRVGAVAVWQTAEKLAVTRGCNVENAFSEAAHAEVVAITNGASPGYRQLRAVYIACPDLASDAPIECAVPCGYCRQWMSEFAGGEDIQVVLVSGSGDVRARLSLFRDLLPMPFRLVKSD